jgi:glycyl-tRNA synthetase
MVDAQSVSSVSLEEIVALAKRRGFVFPTSEIYGGLANSYDYGPLGAELLLQIKNAWWNRFITRRQDMVGLDSQILLHPQTWVASGHVDSFNDPLVEDTITHKRYRADHLIEAWLEQQTTHTDLDNLVVENMGLEEMSAFLEKYQITSPEGNPVTQPKTFNLLFETSIGSVSGEKSVVYLRGETAQGIFTNFKQILDSTRVKLPFGVGQLGKSFRNEITTGQFVFRTLEFEQAEIEYFFNPQQTEWQPLFKQWQDDMWSFLTEDLGINPDNLRWRQHTDTERSFYSLDTWDLEYKYPFGWKELWGIAYRTDYDLKQHIKHSGQSLDYRDPQSGEVVVPHVIEPAVGINRLFLMMLVDSYRQDADKNRTLLQIKPKLAPYQVAIFPLVKNKPELIDKTKAVFQQLLDSQLNPRLTWDDRGNIGKRYLYQDEIGTPFCLTVDYQTLEDETVTIRHRDSANQDRIELASLEQYLAGMLHQNSLGDS